MTDSGSAYETFIRGETIDLVIPNEHAIEHDGWHTWFNDPDVNYFTRHDMFPNTRELQRKHFESLRAAGNSRLDLLVLPKGETTVVGIVALTEIDWRHRSCSITMIMGSRHRAAGAIFHGLEAKARMVEHAFEVMGMERVWSGQNAALEQWQRYQVLFGFRPEGIQRKARRKGYRSFDVVLTACLLDEYLDVKKARGGSYWPGRAKMFDLMRSIPKESVVETVAKAIDAAVQAHFAKLRLS